MLCSGSSCLDRLHSLKINGMNVGPKPSKCVYKSCWLVREWISFLKKHSKSLHFWVVNMQNVKVPLHSGTEHKLRESGSAVMTKTPASCHVSHQEAFYLERGQGLQKPYTNLTHIKPDWIVLRWFHLQAKSILVGYQDIQHLFMEVTESSLFHNIHTPSFWRGSTQGCGHVSRQRNT